LHAPGRRLDGGIARWKELKSDPGARFDAEIAIDISDLRRSTWGTRPDMVEPVTGHVPDPKGASSKVMRERWNGRWLMGLTLGTVPTPHCRSRVHWFVHQRPSRGSRVAASVAKGQGSAPRAMVVPDRRSARRRFRRPRQMPPPASRARTRLLDA
jgi:3-isopropylmalate/(R)-2-methylmalate dehydratase large subunit